jgi:pimeloyl-ACP methyl ester carboxylesterase
VKKRAVRDGTTDTSAAAILDAATRRRITLAASGVEIALLDWGGSGPVALLHHANGFCKGVWGLVAMGLRADYHVVAMDARGHGDSSRPEGPDAYAWERFAEDVVGVAERLAGEEAGGRIALGLGSSFGGTALLGAAARRPGLFERLVLADPVIPAPAHLPLPPERAAAIARLVEGARRRRTRWPSRAAARAQWAARGFFSRWDPRALDLYALDGLRERADGVELKCPAAIEARIFAAGPGLDVLALARGVTTPALLLWAARGDFPRPLFEAVAAVMARARVETVDAGHLIPMERPDLVVDAVRRSGAEAGA